MKRMPTYKSNKNIRLLRNTLNKKCTMYAHRKKASSCGLVQN